MYNGKVKRKRKIEIEKENEGLTITFLLILWLLLSATLRSVKWVGLGRFGVDIIGLGI